MMNTSGKCDFISRSLCLPALGEPFASWKSRSVVTPHTLEGLDLLIHLEGNCHVWAYRAVDPILKFGRQLSGDIISSSCYEVEHEAGSFVFLMLDSHKPSASTASVGGIYDAVRSSGRQLLVVDPTSLYSEPCWTNVRQLLSYRKYELSPDDQFRIIEYIDTWGRAEIETCASLCRSSSNPVGSTLALVANCHLLANLDRQLSLSSVLTRPAERSCANSELSCLVHRMSNFSASQQLVPTEIRKLERDEQSRAGNRLRIISPTSRTLAEQDQPT
jgi:hypothetical protein